MKPPSPATRTTSPSTMRPPVPFQLTPPMIQRNLSGVTPDKFRWIIERLLQHALRHDCAQTAIMLFTEWFPSHLRFPAPQTAVDLREGLQKLAKPLHVDSDIISDEEEDTVLVRLFSKWSYSSSHLPHCLYSRVHTIFFIF